MNLKIVYARIFSYFIPTHNILYGACDIEQVIYDLNSFSHILF